MKNTNINWSSIIVNAYTYSSSLLLFILFIVVSLLLLVWIYEKPQFYKLIYKKSKHSNMLTPIESVEELERDNHYEMTCTTDVIKRLSEISKNEHEIDEEICHLNNYITNT